MRAGNNLLYGRNNATARDLDAGEVTVLCSSAHLEQEDNPLDLNDQTWGSVLRYDLLTPQAFRRARPKSNSRKRGEGSPP